MAGRISRAVKIGLVGAVVGWGAWANVWADTVVLKNGDRLSGQVQLVDSGKLVLKTDYAGEIRIDWDQVAQLETDDPLLVRAPGLPADFQARLAATNRPGEVVPMVPSASPVMTDAPAPLALNDIERIVRPHPFLREWVLSGGLDVALDASHASSSNQNWSAAAHVSARRDVWRHGLRLQYARKTQDSVVGTHHYRAAYTADRFLSEKLFLQGRLRYERDHVDDPARQMAVAVGPGYQFWDNELGAFSVSGLLAHTRYTFQGAGRDHFQSVGLSWAYHRYLWGKQWQVSSDGEIYRALRGGANYDFDANLGLRYSVTQWLSLYAKAGYSRVSVAGQNRSRNTERRYSLGLGVTW